MRLNPHSPILPGSHAVALSAAGHHSEAIAEIAAAVAVNPKNPVGPWYRGQVEAWARHYADAAGWFERARELDPDRAQHAYFLAAAYDQLGRVDDAISLLEKGPPHAQRTVGPIVARDVLRARRPQGVGRGGVRRVPRARLL